MMTYANHSRGFTIVELMVSLVIGSIAILAASEVYLNTRQTFRVQTLQTRLSEDGRFAVSMLQRVISQAGFRPNPATAMGTPLTAVSATSLTVNFQADGINQIACDTSLPAANSTQALVIQKNGSKLQCGTVDWIAPVSSGAGNGTELVDLKLDYGNDTGPSTPTDFGCGATVDSTHVERDCIPDNYTLATAVANPGKIAAVKVCMILRTEATDSSVVKASKVKDCSGSDITSSDTDKKLYREFHTTVQLRNR